MRGKTTATPACFLVGLLVLAAGVSQPRAWGQIPIPPAGHRGAATDVAFSPDGRLLASSSTDGTVKLWDIERGALVRTLAQQHGTVAAVAFSPDALTLAGSCVDGMVVLWDTATGECRRTFQAYEGSQSVGIAFSPDGRILATGSPPDQTLGLWEVETGRPLPRLEPCREDGHPGWAPRQAIWSPDGALVAGGGHCWDARTGELLLDLPRESCLAFSPDGSTLALVYGDLRVRDARNGALRTRFLGPAGVRDAAFSPDGRALASWRDGMVCLWSTADWHLTRAFPTDLPEALALAFSPDSRLLATAHGDGAVRLWDPGTGRLQHTFAGEATFLFAGTGGIVTSVAFSRDGQRVAAVLADGSAQARAVNGGWQQAWRGLAGGAAAAAFDPDLERIAAAEPDGSIGIWKPGNGEPVERLPGHRGGTRALAWSPDGSLLASTGEDRTLRLWEVGREGVSSRHEPLPLEAPGSALAWSPDGRLLAVGDDAGQVRRCEVGRDAISPHHETLRLAAAVTSLAFSPDGVRLAAGGDDGSAIVWQVESGEVLAHAQGGEAAALSLSFFRDGRTLATGSADRMARVWNLENEHLSAAAAVTDAVHSVAFSPDGALLAVAGDDRQILLLQVSGWGRQPVELWSQAEPPDREAPLPPYQPVLRTGHTGPVLAAAFAPDGRTLATGGYDFSVRLWDAPTGRLQAVLSAHTDKVMALAFAPDRPLFASGGREGAIYLWDAATQHPVLSLREGHPVDNLAFAPDGAALAGGCELGGLTLWDPESGRELWTTHALRGSIRGLAFAPDGKTLVSGHEDSYLQLWDVATGRQMSSVALPEGCSPRRLAFSPDGRWLAAGDEGEEAPLVLWDTTTWRPVRTFSLPPQEGYHDDSLWDLAFSPDGRLLATGHEDGWLRLWDPFTGEVLQTLSAHRGWAAALAFSPDGRMLASGGADSQVRLWNPLTGRLRLTLRGYERGISCVAFSPDGRRLYSACEDNRVDCWDLASRSVRHLQREPDYTGTHGVTSVAVAPDGRSLASGHGDGTLVLWNAAEETVRWRLPSGSGPVAFTPDGAGLYAANPDGITRFYSAHSGQESTGHTNLYSQAEALALSPDGRRLLLGKGSDVRVWDVASGTMLFILGTGHRVRALAVSPDGKTAAGAWNRFVTLWEPETGRILRRFEEPQGEVLSLAFSPDGRTLATGCQRKAVRLWDAATGALRHTLQGHEGSVNSVAFSPDGHTLATGCDDGVLRLWDAATGELRASLIALPPGDEGTLAPSRLIIAGGYYDASPEAARFLQWRIGDHLYPVECFEPLFRQPERVRRALSGEALSDDLSARFLRGELIPPEVSILTAVDGQEVTGDRLRMEIAATDDGTVSEMEILVNGRVLTPKPIRREAKPIPREAKPIAREAKPIVREAKPIPREAKPIPAQHQMQYTFEADVALPPGEREVVLRAVAHDNDGLQNWAEVRLTRPDVVSAGGDLYVLAVGVSRYRDERLNLQFAARDAQAFADLWQQLGQPFYANVHTVCLTDEEATAGRVQAALRELAARCTENDHLLLFLSGHGLRDLEHGPPAYYFGVHEVDPAHLEQTALPWSALEDALRASDAHRVVAFLDACHAGSPLEDLQATNERLAALLVKRGGVMVFAGSQGDGYSYELPEAGHGAFTAGLLEGLEQGRADLPVAGRADGLITAQELLLYLQARVRQLTDGRQIPHSPLMFDFGESVPLFKVAP